MLRTWEQEANCAGDDLLLKNYLQMQQKERRSAGKKIVGSFFWKSVDQNTIVKIIKTKQSLQNCIPAIVCQ